jgi:hypothetical protein
MKNVDACKKKKQNNVWCNFENKTKIQIYVNNIFIHLETESTMVIYEDFKMNYTIIIIVKL